MPIYEYQCQACGHEFEQLQKVSEDPIKQCPKCSKEAAQRLVSASGFQLKGTGWYETDFKNSGQKKPDESSSGADKDSSKGTKNESKRTEST